MVELIERAHAARAQAQRLRTQTQELKLSCRRTSRAGEAAFARAFGLGELGGEERLRRLDELGVLPWRQPDAALERVLFAVD